MKVLRNFFFDAVKFQLYNRIFKSFEILIR